MNADRTILLGVVLLVVGGGVGGVGLFFLDSTVGQCSPYYLDVETNPEGYPDAPRVAYENLTADQQTAFRETLATDPDRPGSYVRPISEVYFDGPTVVRYRGESYLVTTLATGGCHPLAHDLVRVLPLLLGGGLVLAGAIAVRRGSRRASA